MKNIFRFLGIIAITAILGMVTTCEDLNKDTDSEYTVSFEANGGIPAPESQTITRGWKVTEPAAMTKGVYGFGGWYKEAAFTGLWNFNSDTVTRDITLYAKWIPAITVQGKDLVEKFEWLNSNAESGGVYILQVNNDAIIGPQELSFSGKSNILIQLKGTNGVRNIDPYGSVSITIGSGVTLILDENIVLKFPVTVNGGNLIMNNGSKINGGGVVLQSGTFTMNGGTISGNTYGVNVQNGTFIMNGGTISGNTYRGVLLQNGTFTMDGGEISGNRGGVNVRRGTFTMNGGVISGNTSSVIGSSIINDNDGSGGGCL